MRECDKKIDECPELSYKMVQADIRNRQAQQELVNFEKNKTFLYIHPFTEEEKFYRDQRTKLYEIRYKYPEKFIQEITNTQQNIRRIESNIRTGKYKDEKERISWQKNLSKAKGKLRALKEML